MIDVASQELDRRFAERFSEEEIADLFKGGPISARDKKLALGGLLAQQNGYEPGAFSAPTRVLGIDIFGEAPEYAKKKKLEAQQNEFLNAFQAHDFKLNLQESLFEMQQEQERERTGRTGAQMTPTTLMNALELGLIPTTEQTTLEPTGSPTSDLPQFDKGLFDSLLQPQGVGADQRLGPEQPLFQDTVRGGDEFDEFGATRLQQAGASPNVEPTAFLSKALEGDAGLELMRAIEREDTSGIASLSRQQDPGLQPPTEEVTRLIPDLNAPISPQAAFELAQTRRTELRTPKEQTVQPEVLRASIATILTQSGASEETINKTLAALPQGSVRSSIASSLLTQATSIQNTFNREAGKEFRLKESELKQRRLMDKAADIKAGLMKTGSQLSLDNKLIVSQVNQQHQLDMQQGRISAAKIKQEEGIRQRFENRLVLQAKEQAFTGEENELNRISRNTLAVMRGEQQLTLEDARQMGRLALKDVPGKDRVSTMEKFYLDLMKSNPAIADQFLDILGNAEDPLDPFTDQAVRGALAKRFGEIVNSNVVRDAVNNTVRTNMYGESPRERMDSLESFKAQFLAEGMSIEDLEPITTQLEAMEKNAKLSASSNEVNIKLPGTAQERQAVVVTRGLLEQVDDISGLFNKNYVGPVDTWIGQGFSIANISSKERLEFETLVKELVASITSERAGSAVSEHEQKLFIQSIPHLEMPDDKFLASLRVMNKMLQRKHRSLMGMAGMTSIDVFKELTEFEGLSKEDAKYIMGVYGLGSNF